MSGPKIGRAPPRPSRQLCEAIVSKYAKRLGISEHDIIVGKSPRQTWARGMVFEEIVERSGCSAAGLTEVWGAEPRTIQHAIRRVRDARATC